MQKFSNAAVDLTREFTAGIPDAVPLPDSPASGPVPAGMSFGDSDDDEGGDGAAGFAGVG